MAEHFWGKSKWIIEQAQRDVAKCGDACRTRAITYAHAHALAHAATRVRVQGMHHVLFLHFTSSDMI